MYIFSCTHFCEDFEGKLLNVYAPVLQDTVLRDHSGTILFSTILTVREMGVSGLVIVIPFVLQL